MSEKVVPASPWPSAPPPPRLDLARGKVPSPPAAWLDLTPDPVLQVSRDGHILYLNPASQEQFPSWHAHGGQHPLLDQWDAARQRLTAGETVVLQEVDLGETVYALTLRRNPGDDSAWLFAHDITRQKQAEGYNARLLRENAALTEINQMLAGSQDLPVVLQQIAHTATALLGQVDRAVLHLLDEERDCLRAAAVAGTTSFPPTAALNLKRGEGIAGIVLATGRPLTLADAPADPRYRMSAGAANAVRSLLVAPVALGEKCLGTLSVQSAQPNVYTPEDEHLLTSLGAQAALALEKAQLLNAERENRQFWQAMSQVAVGLTSSLEFEVVLDRLLEQIRAVVPYDSATLMLAEAGKVHVVRTAGHEKFGAQVQDYVRTLAWDLEDMASLRRMAETGQPQVVADTLTDPNWVEIKSLDYIRSWAGAPIISQGQVVAFLSLNKTEPDFYTPTHARYLAAFAVPAALALQNARLYRDLKRALEDEQHIRQQLVQHEKLAALGRIVASVAHELNNPLQTIQHALYLVRIDAGLSAQSRQDLTVALDEATRMADLVLRLRDTYRPTARTEFTPVSLAALVTEVHRLLEAHLREHRVQFHFDPPPDLPPVPLVRDQIKQVVINLVLNAVEAMPAGGAITVTTAAEAEGVRLAISDTGPGVPPAMQSSIFDPFFTTKQGGTGLGLAITYDLIQRHGGTIDLVSPPGQGATFAVWLPTTAPPLAEPAARPAD